MRDTEIRSAVKAETAVVDVDAAGDAGLSRAEQMRRDGMHRRIAWNSIRSVQYSDIACQQPVRRRPVIAVTVREAADDRTLVHHFRMMRHQLADPQSRQRRFDRLVRVHGHLRRLIRLHYRMCRAAGHHAASQNDGTLGCDLVADTRSL